MSTRLQFLNISIFDFLSYCSYSFFMASAIIISSFVGLFVGFFLGFLLGKKSK